MCNQRTYTTHQTILSLKSIETVNLHTLSGKTIAIDASLFMYKMLINVRKSDKSYFTSQDGKVVVTL